MRRSVLGNVRVGATISDRVIMMLIMILIMMLMIMMRETESVAMMKTGCDLFRLSVPVIES